MKQRISAINVRTLSIALRKSNNIFSYSTFLGLFCQGLPSFIDKVRWLEVPKQCCLEPHPAGYVTLDTMPGIRISFQQSDGNLASLGVILEVYRVKVGVQLMNKPTDCHPVSLASKTCWKTWL